MNIFNRIIMVILLLFFISISAIGIINIYADIFTWAEMPSLFLSPQVRMNPYLGTAILAGIFIVSLILLVFEFYRRRPRRAALKSDERGKAMVTTRSLSKEIDGELLRLDGIKSVKTKTIVKKDGIFADIYAKVIEGHDVSSFTEKARDAVYGFLTRNMGLDVEKIDFTITGFVPEKKMAEKTEEDFIVSQVKEALLEGDDQGQEKVGEEIIKNDAAE